MSSIDFQAKLEQLMDETAADHANWTYRAVRPIAVGNRPWRKGMKVISDCSKGVQKLCWWAHCPHDPLGRNWDEYGNSQTLWSACQHLDHASDLRVGDFVTFGRDGEEHAAMVRKTGADPLLWSDGHQGAPNFYRLSQDKRTHQYLRNPLPKYEPTKAERCRARTGWFAWVAWRLGEGDWHTYGNSNPKVRPNVPKRIPFTWWTRYARFIARRKKADRPKTAPPNS